MNVGYAMSLRKQCPKNVDPRTAITLDPTTPQRFDNMYYKNLQQGEGCSPLISVCIPTPEQGTLSTYLQQTTQPT
ncbi:hypothetical protein ACLB2K_009613 [Fragaria x ananassa]